MYMHIHMYLPHIPKYSCKYIYKYIYIGFYAYELINI